MFFPSDRAVFILSILETFSVSFFSILKVKSSRMFSFHPYNLCVLERPTNLQIIGILFVVSPSKYILFTHDLYLFLFKQLYPVPCHVIMMYTFEDVQNHSQQPRI